jgi:hypothetical protein
MTTKADHPTTRRWRLSAALRDNLKRRKAQTRGRADEAKKAAGGEPEGRDIRNGSKADR